MFKDFEGRTEEEARNKAIEELGLEGGDFDVEILENVKKSLFKKPSCKIRVYYGNDEEETMDEEDMEEYSKNNILMQAGQSMLTQANQSTQGVLSLLQ